MIKYKHKEYYQEEFEKYILNLALTPEMKDLAYTVWFAAIEKVIETTNRYQKEWRHNNQDKVQKYIMTSMKKWKDENKSHTSNYNKTYFQEWYKKNKEKRLKYNREHKLNKKNKLKELESI